MTAQTSSFRFAISATFSAEPLQAAISFWGRQLGVSFEARFSAYNQLVQSLLNPSGEFARNHRGLNVLLVRLEDLGPPSEPDRIEAHVCQLLDALRKTSADHLAPILVCLCPSSTAFVADAARAAFARKMGRLIQSNLEETPAVQFLHFEEIGKRYPVLNWESATGDRLGKIPYTEEYFAALATALVRYAHSLFMAPYKVIVLDCDDTLWKGICGEDGPAGIYVDAPRLALQEFMLQQREAGMLLCLASKNNEEDVREVFANHPEMPLQLRHFTAWRINWESKADSLKSLAMELQLGLDSFIFVDDNPKECAEASDRIPELLSIPLPANVDEIPHFLDHVWAFDHAVITEEDRNRNAYYAQQQEFGHEIRKTANLEAFILGLKLTVNFVPLKAETAARASQLTQRTNQFNFTTIRRSEAELMNLTDSQECYTIDISDRFGDYGITGLVIVSKAGTDLVVDTFLLSCRVLGRGVEHRVVSWLGKAALARGAEFVELSFAGTTRNLPARQFLDSLGSRRRFPAAALRDLVWHPVETIPAVPGAPAVVEVSRFLEHARIADTLSTPERIHAAVAQDRLKSAAPPRGMTTTEQTLSTIWAELLEVPSVGVADNFFDLGGHSLLAVLLLLRIKETFGVELPIDDVYGGSLTLGDLATRIETFHMGVIDPQEYERLLQEIEGLSEEEAQALLANEEQG
ncbi:MAG: HAD-IIIC family phosphatase [Bryobacteraceae bacterium]